MPMRYAVTGGAGFIGSNLVARLLLDGNEVYIVDNMTTGSEEVVSLLRKWGAKFVRGSSSKASELNVDGIFHLGMPSSSPMYKKDPSLVVEVIKDFVPIMEKAREGIKVVMASTSSIYNGHEPPHHEDLPVLVTDYYTEARYWAERLGQVYRQMYDVEFVSLRLFSVYGPNERPKGRYANVLSQMIWAGLEGKPFVIYGDGSQTRDFIYVGDVVEAFVKAMERSVSGTFNVGTGVETSFNQLAERIVEVTGLDLKIEYMKNPIKNYVYRTKASTVRAERELRFKAEVSLDEGISRVFPAYKEGRLELAFKVV